MKVTNYRALSLLAGLSRLAMAEEIATWKDGKCRFCWINGGLGEIGNSCEGGDPSYCKDRIFEWLGSCGFSGEDIT